ncbi:MAG: MarC family protein [Pseudohongiellaceae bacterium]
METLAAAVTLFLIMDPLGNIPVFLSILSRVPEARRHRVLVRELLIALALMLAFLFLGPGLLHLLGLSPEAIAIGGGLVLMIIAIRMIFPSRGGVMGDDGSDDEPLIVPLAVPLIAGPSVLATLVLLAETGPERSGDWLLALMGAWLVTAAILLASPTLYGILGSRGLKAIERLMGMILVSISVQMLLDGFAGYLG